MRKESGGKNECSRKHERQVASLTLSWQQDGTFIKIPPTCCLSLHKAFSLNTKGFPLIFVNGCCVTVSRNRLVGPVRWLVNRLQHLPHQPQVPHAQTRAALAPGPPRSRPGLHILIFWNNFQLPPFQHQKRYKSKVVESRSVGHSCIWVFQFKKRQHSFPHCQIFPSLLYSVDYLQYLHL